MSENEQEKEANEVLSYDEIVLCCFVEVKFIIKLFMSERFIGTSALSAIIASCFTVGLWFWSFDEDIWVYQTSRVFTGASGCFVFC